MSEPRRLMRDLTDPAPVPEAGIARAVELMRSGRLFRYGELGADQADAALLEREFAPWSGDGTASRSIRAGARCSWRSRFSTCAPTSRSSSTPSPSRRCREPCPRGRSARHRRHRPDYKIDVEDLRRKASDSGARVLMLSHMRGHLADMDAVMAVCDELGLLLVEDCAHALGARWGERMIGTFGVAAGFSAQTYKHLNAGEGGFLVVDDPDLAARAILHSGSYMLHQQHLDPPPPETMARWTERTPNFSLRMTALAAALLRAAASRPARTRRAMERHLQAYRGRPRRAQAVRLPVRPPAEHFTATSIQFSLPGLSAGEITAVLDLARARGLPIKWFGAAEQAGFTSAPRHWRYAPGRAASTTPIASSPRSATSAPRCR